MSEVEKNIKKYKLWVNIISIAIPVVVALLFGIKLPNIEPLTFLPPIYASINAITSILLISALIAIKNKKMKLHRSLMQTAIFCSVIFLLMYVAYHITSVPTKYEGEMIITYRVILISHIILSIVVIPLVLHSYIRAYLGDYQVHKKIVRYAYPVWLYVAVTGVIVYIMISPYYS